MNKSQKILLLAALAGVALWAVPGLRILMLPFIYLGTHIHELCHAVMALATGGQPESIHVFMDGSGVTPVSGGNVLLVAAAGYPGAAFAGSLLILSGKTERGARRAFAGVATALGLSLLLLVRGDLAGVLSALFWIPVLACAAWKLDDGQIRFASQFVGIVVGLNAFQSLLNLWNISLSGSIPTDATILAEHYWIPAPIWSALFFALAAVVTGAALVLTTRAGQKQSR
ncbi:MAG: M50 family metallopeptidase [Armatimonadetes bacterium]|nr:M50 family metallopeptidase [Armatimonadota bacterium]